MPVIECTCASCGDSFNARWPGESEASTCWSCLGLDITQLSRSDGRHQATTAGQRQPTAAKPYRPSSKWREPVPASAPPNNGHSPSTSLLDALNDL
jgi:hypothetical protein